MQDMAYRHEYDNLMRDIAIYDGKNMGLADWLLQIEKVALLTNSYEYELATDKLIGRDKTGKTLRKKTGRCVVTNC